MNDNRALIKAVVVATGDRPFALSRCLPEIIDNLHESGRTPRIVIADNSVDTRHASRNRMIVNRFKLQEHLNITLIGNEERRRLVESFVSLGFDRNISSFAINGLNVGLPCVGSNRNVLLFASASESFVSLDDDTRLSFADCGQFDSQITKKALRVTAGNGSPVERWLFPNREVLLGSAVLVPVDFLAEHETLLGCEILRQSSEVEACHGGRKVKTSSARVGLTIGGLIGDCGWGTPSRHLFMNANSAKRITDESYSSVIVSREMAQIAPSYCITDQADDMMSTSFACDGRIRCPPFFPVGRGEDSLFARLIRRVEPDLCFGHIPFGIYHDPFEKRRFWPGELFRDAATIDLSSFFCCLIDLISPNASIDGSSLSKIGIALKRIGNVSKAEFLIYAEECRTSLVIAKRQQLEEKLSVDFPMTSSYRSDVNTYLQRLLEGAKRREGAIPIELLVRNDEDSALSLAQEMVSLYGELLLVWPEMLEASLSLREYGGLGAR